MFYDEPPSPETPHERDLRIFAYRAMSLLYKIGDEAHERLDPVTYSWEFTHCTNLPNNFAEQRAKLTEDLRRLTQ